MFAETIPAGSLVLDAGAGDQVYRPLFAHTRYEAADFEQIEKPYAKSTYVCDLTNIPVEDCRFDFIICNQVLEHLPEPLDALSELRRVLKPGGRAIFTVPFFYEEHEQPFDFYRYTQFAHRHLFSKAGFTILSLDWMEGYLGTVAYQLEGVARNLPVRPSDVAPGIAGWLTCPLIAALKLFSFAFSLILYRLDTKHRYTRKGYPKNYVLVVERDEAGSRSD